MLGGIAPQPFKSGAWEGRSTTGAGSSDTTCACPLLPLPPTLPSSPHRSPRALVRVSLPGGTPCVSSAPTSCADHGACSPPGGSPADPLVPAATRRGSAVDARGEDLPVGASVKQRLGSPRAPYINQRALKYHIVRALKSVPKVHAETVAKAVLGAISSFPVKGGRLGDFYNSACRLLWFCAVGRGDEVGGVASLS